MKRQLILEDGSVFIGYGFGSDKEMTGEVVFNTGMTGYQEIIIRSFLLQPNCYTHLPAYWKLRH